jgi:hypothetical protein
VKETCWYNAQKSFTKKLLNIINGHYIRFEDKNDCESYGIEYKGPGYYPKRSGDVLLDGVLYDTFTFDYTYTVKTKL